MSQQQDDNGDVFLPLIQEEQQQQQQYAFPEETTMTAAEEETTTPLEPTSTNSDLLNLTSSYPQTPEASSQEPVLVNTPQKLPAMVSLQSPAPASSPLQPLQQQQQQQPPLQLQTLQPQQQQQPQYPQAYGDQNQPVLEQGFSVLGVWILACLLVILSIILIVLVAHVIRQRHRIMSIMFPNYTAHRQRTSRRHVKATLARIERRYETIEGWIVSKRVVAHDEFCEGCVDVFAKAAAAASAAAAAAAANSTKALDDPAAAAATNETTDPVDKDADAVEFGMHTKEKILERLRLQQQLELQQQQQNDSHGNNNADIEQGGGCCGTGGGAVIKHLETCDTEDEDDDDSTIQQHAHMEQRECPICFDEFRVGQVISFSANPECCHVFHHECIKEWLLRHINCPFCRKVCMHVDEYRGATSSCKTKPHVIQELLDKHSKRSATTYYCIRDGLVVIPPKVRCTKRELKQLKHRICDCIVDRQELAKLRGNRQEVTVTNHNTQGIMLREIAPGTTDAGTTNTGGGGATTVLGIAADHGANDGNDNTANEMLAGVQQQEQRGPWLHHHYETTTSSPPSPPRPIVLLEMASVQEDENDYDPTERDDEDDLDNVFPQGQLDDASVSEHVTVECDDDDDDSSDSDAAAAENEAAVHNKDDHGPPRTGTIGLSMMMLGRQHHGNNSSTRTTGTSTDDDEEMLLREVEDVSVDYDNDGHHDDDDDDMDNVQVDGHDDDDDESHQSNVEEKKTVTTTGRVRSADDMLEVTV